MGLRVTESMAWHGESWQVDEVSTWQGKIWQAKTHPKQ